MEEKISRYEKVQEFLNDNDNGLVIRLGIAILGVVLGLIIVMLSLLFESGSGVAVIFIVFGCVIAAALFIAPAVWYLSDC